MKLLYDISCEDTPPHTAPLFFNSRYALIARSRSASIIAFCAIDSTPSRRLVPPVTPVSLALRGFAPRGSFFRSGGASAMSFSRRGADVENLAKSVGRSFSCAFAFGAGLAGAVSSSLSSLFALEGFLRLEESEGAEGVDLGFCLAALASSSSFFTLRATAAETCIASRTSGRIDSSTRLCSRHGQPSAIYSQFITTHLLKCASDSPGMIFIVVATPLRFGCSSPLSVRGFFLFPAVPSPSPSSLRLRKSSWIFAAFRMRAAPFGIASLLSAFLVAAPGARLLKA